MSVAICAASVVFFIIAVAAVDTSIAPDEQIVSTKDGLVRGLKETTIVESREFYSFKGIPFAKPPIGNLRFKVSFVFKI